MTPAQKLQIRMSELREKANGLADATTPEDISERSAATSELTGMEAKYRAALTAEAASETTAES